MSGANTRSKKSNFAKAIISRLPTYNQAKELRDLVDALEDFVSSAELDAVRRQSFENLQTACETLWMAVSYDGRKTYYERIAYRLNVNGFSEAAGILAPGFLSEQESSEMVSEQENHVREQLYTGVEMSTGIGASSGPVDAEEYADLISRMSQACSHDDLILIKNYLQRRFPQYYKEVDIRHDKSFDSVVRSLERLELVNRYDIEVVIASAKKASSLDGFLEELQQYQLENRPAQSPSA